MVDDQLAENVVDPLDQRLGRSPIPAQLRWLFGERSSGLEENGYIGSSEPVDRLLWVANEEQSARLDFDMGPAPLGRPSDRRLR